MDSCLSVVRVTSIARRWPENQVGSTVSKWQCWQFQNIIASKIDDEFAFSPGWKKISRTAKRRHLSPIALQRTEWSHEVSKIFIPQGEQSETTEKIIGICIGLQKTIMNSSDLISNPRQKWSRELHAWESECESRLVLKLEFQDCRIVLNLLLSEQDVECKFQIHQKVTLKSNLEEPKFSTIKWMLRNFFWWSLIVSTRLRFEFEKQHTLLGRLERI